MTNISRRKIWIFLFILSLMFCWGPQGPFFPAFVIMIASFFTIILESVDKKYSAKISIIEMFLFIILCSIWILFKGTAPDVMIILIIAVGGLIVMGLVDSGFILEKWFQNRGCKVVGCWDFAKNFLKKNYYGVPDP
ncbi:hypothetical protein [Methanobacterium alcaliphilum]|uniref:hypothetical protein n=1 Tax=Methanobacterium alcaliphilum TaxID=392018 RepID=UPI00200ABE18|nr:hypothetical protein [Methanobacterium alcaliphilum]MCK9151838.1 hypothetical protein [Methanobacterium alcaliphilum]